MSRVALATRKRVAHRLKRAWHRLAALDAWVDRRLDPGPGRDGPWRRRLREHLLHRLFPERRLRDSPFGMPPAPPAVGLVRFLCLIPPEDTGGGSRPAQLAAELHHRGFAIQWWWALPIYPWPRRRRPPVARVDARPVDEVARSPEPADLVVVEAPHPALLEALRSAPRRGPIVYDAIDVWDGSLGAGWYDPAAEDRLLSTADHLTASATLLRDEIAARTGRSVALLPNAIDLDRFAPGATTPAAIDRGRPTIIYVGALWGEWIDVDLLELLAVRLPDAIVHLVGPTGGRRMPRRANLRLHGARPRAVIPSLLAAADVAIVPFVPSRLAAAVSPLKVFEYLAMERPVVSTRLPDLEGVPGVTIADDPEAFARAVRAAATRPFPAAAARAFLADQTWSRRADRLLELTRLARG